VTGRYGLKAAEVLPVTPRKKAPKKKVAENNVQDVN